MASDPLEQLFEELGDKPKQERFAVRDLQPFETNKFHNERPAQTVIQSERFEHYAIIALFAKGLTQTEIARQSGYSDGQISQILRQPWARQRLFQIVSEEGGDIVAETLRLEVLPSIQTIIEVRDGENSSPRERLAASEALLNRFLGKPKETVEHINGGKSQSAKDADALDAAIKAAEAEVRKLSGGVDPTERREGESPNSNSGPS